MPEMKHDFNSRKADCIAVEEASLNVLAISAATPVKPSEI